MKDRRQPVAHRDLRGDPRVQYGETLGGGPHGPVGGGPGHDIAVQARQEHAYVVERVLGILRP
ncbi:hypothetical protein GCM10010303_57010 [Streptomyces purpurascens]|nr:hypothetical protein GCM10010303_57010 [Streptomyces purpurascens]